MSDNTDKNQARLDRVSETSLPELELRFREVHALQELKAYQIKLEMQNQALRETQERLKEAHDSYADLYNFSPAGYLTLDKNGCVLDTNLTATLLLDRERANVVGKYFADWLAPGETGPFLDHLDQACASTGTGNTVIRTKIMTSGKLRHVRLESSASHDASGRNHYCRMVMTDITLSMQTERRTKKLLQENRRLTRRLFTVQESERRHLARELHDELGQWLTAIQADAQAIHCVSCKTPDVCATCDESAKAIVSGASQIHRVVRRILRRLRPAVLDQLGLTDSLKEIVGQWRTHHPEVFCELKLEGALDDLHETINITLYRTVQEALTNISSHADARRVSINLCREPEHILLSVTDDGLGMDMHLPSLGLGLLGMRERAIAAEGEFSFASKPGQGLRIDVKLPLTQSEPKQ
jgi:PAS domain S-box-containing protein